MEIEGGASVTLRLTEIVVGKEGAVLAVGVLAFLGERLKVVIVVVVVVVVVVVALVVVVVVVVVAIVAVVLVEVVLVVLEVAEGQLRGGCRGLRLSAALRFGLVAWGGDLKTFEILGCEKTCLRLVDVLAVTVVVTGVVAAVAVEAVAGTVKVVMTTELETLVLGEVKALETIDRWFDELI